LISRRSVAARKSFTLLNSKGGPMHFADNTLVDEIS
jgi:hypothetical protein